MYYNEQAMSMLCVFWCLHILAGSCNLQGCLYLIFLIVKVVFAAHFVENSTALASTYVGLRVKVGQDNTLPVLSLLLSQSQTESRLGLLSILCGTAVIGHGVSEQGMIAQQGQPRRAAQAGAELLAGDEDKLFADGATAAPAHLILDDEAGGRRGGAVPLPEPDQHALAALVQAPLGLGQAAVPGLAAPGGLVEAAGAQDGGGEVGEDGEGVGFVLAQGRGEHHGHV
jgi:hypothetical protein